MGLDLLQQLDAPQRWHVLGLVLARVHNLQLEGIAQAKQKQSKKKAAGSGARPRPQQQRTTADDPAVETKVGGFPPIAIA